MHVFRFILLLSTAVVGFGQGTKADYERAFALSQLTADTIFRDRVTPHWLPDGASFWYRVTTTPGQSEHVLVDALTGQRTGGLTAAELARLLSLRLGQPIDSAKLPGAESSESSGDAPPAETRITFVNRTKNPVSLYWLPNNSERERYGTIEPDGRFNQPTFAGHRWIAEGPGGVTLGTFVGRNDPQVVEIREGNTNQATRPTGTITSKAKRDDRPEWSAFVRERNVWVLQRETGKEFQLSRDGTDANAYHEDLMVSPDGLKVVTRQVEPPQKHKVYLIESSPEDQVQPKLKDLDYLKPGDRIAHPRPRLFDLQRRAPIPVSDDLFPNPWAIDRLRWAADGSQFTFLYNERGHQLMRVIAVDAATGAARTLIEERSATFIDYSQKTELRWLEQSGEFIWASERDGWNHLYLFDAKTGALKNQITRGEWVVRGIDYIDESARVLWLKVMGSRPGEDPYHVHLARVNFDGTGFQRLTKGDGTHRWDWSPDRRFFVDTWSRVDAAPVTELRRSADGVLVCDLERADVTRLLATGWSAPERFVAKGRDGRTDIHGIIVVPSNFDPKRRYPVIEKIYAGPHGFFVPKEWDRELQAHAMAELGFVVVQIDGMGTNWRSRAFHDVAWRNLKDAGFPDRIAWLRAAATTRPWLDLTRVGIFGGSAGGQNALAALLHHGDFYRAAAADCGCHDNRMDKIWWNEAWLGTMGPHYAENSNVTHAAKLQGKLLLTFGELDRNVDPASTMQVVNALVKADKDFELIVVPGADHGAGEKPYPARRRMDFFVRHLLGVEPR